MSTLVFLFKYNNGFQKEIKEKLEEVMSLNDVRNVVCFNLIVNNLTISENKGKVVLRTNSNSSHNQVYRFFKCYDDDDYVDFDNLIMPVPDSVSDSDNPTILVATKLSTYSSLLLQVEKTLHLEVIDQTTDEENYKYWKSLLQKEGKPITQNNWRYDKWVYRYLKIW